MKRLAAFIIMLMLCVSFTQARTTTLVVFAASSLTDAFEAIADSYEADHPGTEILFNFAGSSTLAAQIDQGAPADIFASADPAQMQVAVEAGRIAGEPVPFAHNRLVVIAPHDNPADLQTPLDLTTPGLRLILAAPGVPIREYTEITLRNYEIREAALENLVSEEANVRQVAAKVALGEADAGVVYQSDVTPDVADQLTVIDIPDEYNARATYPIAVTDDTDSPTEAARFIADVLADAGQDTLAEWGFVPVRDLVDESEPSAANPQSTPVR